VGTLPVILCAESCLRNRFLRSRTTLFASFSGKSRISQLQLFSWGQAPKPPGSASPNSGLEKGFCEAELRFLLLLEKEGSYNFNCFLGGNSQTPWVGFAEFWVRKRLLRSRTTLFASFSGKRRILRLQWLASLRNSRVGFRKSFYETEPRFLLLFLEKEGSCNPSRWLGDKQLGEEQASAEQFA
jgi:hypothetical protein